MTGRLKDEIKQKKPFRSIEQEVFLNLQRTADALSRRMSMELKPLGLSAAQFNVLRILRGAHPEGLPCGEIGERMVTHDPDITRLLDRLEKRGLIERCRESKDRRVITTRISKEGLRLVGDFDEREPELLKEMLGHVGKQRLEWLCELLEAARNREIVKT